jgi:toxin ParE1/3/4
MIYEVITTEQAEADLRGVYEYIAFELLSPDNAAGQLDRLEEHIIGLESFPEKFRAYEKEPWHSRGLRVMPVDNYLIFYIPDKEAGIVTVIRVMYAGRNVEDQLKNHTVM